MRIEFILLRHKELQASVLNNMSHIKQYKSIELTTYYADGSTEYFQGSYIPENMHIVLNITFH